MDFFATDFRREGHEVYLAPGFGAWPQEFLASDSGLHAFHPDAVLLVRTRPDGPAVDFAALPYPVVVPDLAQLAAETPGFYDERMEKLAGLPFSLAGLKAIEDEFRWALLARPAKVLALDADNTLWRGIAVEEDGTPVVPHAALQKGLLALRDRGVLLALFSKNDLPLVRAVLARPEMALKETDFAFLGVNWSPKPGNLAAAAEELNLGRDAFVFLDDSGWERAEMAARLPEVAVPPYGPDVYAAQTLRRLAAYFFGGLGHTEEDRRRAAMYREEAARRAAAGKTASVADYLASLRLTAAFARATAADVPRLAQMAGKTNQFNATSRRRSEDEFRRLIADEGQRVWSVRAGDRFGEQGLVCYVVYAVGTRRITDFVMSCRAMGRTLEGFVLNAVKAALAAEGLTLEGIDFVPTAKNGPFQTFLRALDLTAPQTTHFTDRNGP